MNAIDSHVEKANRGSFRPADRPLQRRTNCPGSRDCPANVCNSTRRSGARTLAFAHERLRFADLPRELRLRETSILATFLSIQEDRVAFRVDGFSIASVNATESAIGENRIVQNRLN